MVRLCITMFFTGVLFQKTAWGPTSASASLVAVCHRPLARATGRPAIWPSKSCLTWPWTWKISQWMRSVPCWSGAQRPRWTPSNLSKDVERTPDNFCAYRNRSAETATCDGGPNFRKVSRQTDHDSPEAMNQNETSWGFWILFALSSLWKHREFVLHIFICWGLEGLHSVRLVADYKTFFAQMSVDAISMLGDDLSVSSVGIKKVTGGSVTDTMLVEGVCFKKCFSYAGRFWAAAKALRERQNFASEPRVGAQGRERQCRSADNRSRPVSVHRGCWVEHHLRPSASNKLSYYFVQRSTVHCGCVFSRRLNFFNSSFHLISSSSSSVFSAAARRSWSWLRSLVQTLC